MLTIMEERRSCRIRYTGTPVRRVGRKAWVGETLELRRCATGYREAKQVFPHPSTTSGIQADDCARSLISARAGNNVASASAPPAAWSRP
jgi:hypothetical protein